jgi:hypothetical protein
MKRETEKSLQEYLRAINNYDILETDRIARPLSLLWLLLHSTLDESERLRYAKKIHSSFLFNVVLVRIIENLLERGDMEQAKEYAKLYRMDGLPELERVQRQRKTFSSSLLFRF